MVELTHEETEKYIEYISSGKRIIDIDDIVDERKFPYVI